MNNYCNVSQVSYWHLNLRLRSDDGTQSLVPVKPLVVGLYSNSFDGIDLLKMHAWILPERYQYSHSAFAWHSLWHVIGSLSWIVEMSYCVEPPATSVWKSTQSKYYQVMKNGDTSATSTLYNTYCLQRRFCTVHKLWLPNLAVDMKNPPV